MNKIVYKNRFITAVLLMIAMLMPQLAWADDNPQDPRLSIFSNLNEKGVTVQITDETDESGNPIYPWAVDETMFTSSEGLMSTNYEDRNTSSKLTLTFTANKNTSVAFTVISVSSSFEAGHVKIKGDGIAEEEFGGFSEEDAVRFYSIELENGEPKSVTLDYFNIGDDEDEDEEFSSFAVITDFLVPCDGDHDWSEWWKEDATCERTGYEGRECKVCHFVEEHIIPVKPHSLVKTDRHDPKDCSEIGNIEYWSCTECHKMWADEAMTTPLNSEEIKIILDHSFGDDGFCSVCHAFEPAPKAADGYYELSKSGHLHWFAQFVNTYINGNYDNANANARLMNDIDAKCTKDFQWKPIGTGYNSYGYYNGTFDGNHKTITNIYLEEGLEHWGYKVGFIGELRSGGVLKDLTIKNSTIISTRGQYISAFVGNCQGSVSGCNNYATVHGNSYVGGIAGQLYVWGDITNCTNYGDISFDHEGGGVVGKIDVHGSGSLSRCVNWGNVTGSGADVGGIVGNAHDGQITECENHGNINSTMNSSQGAFVGGITGGLLCTKMTGCINTGNVTSICGGVGGLTGYYNDSEIYNSYSTGDVSATNADSQYGIGGCIGHCFGTNTKVSSTFSTGKVSFDGSSKVGAFIGEVGDYKKITITNSYALDQSLPFCGKRYNGSTINLENSSCMPTSAFQSGEVTWNLNGKSDVDPIWYQYIGEDGIPTLNKDEGTIVHYDNNSFFNDLELPTYTLADGTAYQTRVVRNIDELTYTHSFDNSGAWYSYYVPFQMPVGELTANDVKVAFINGIHQYDNNGDGIVDRTDLEVIYVKEGTLRANYPYLVKTASAADVSITLNDVILQPSAKGSVINLATASANYYIRGTYEGIQASEAAANRYHAVGMDSRGNSALVIPNNNIPAQRWYLTIEENDSPVIHDDAMAREFRIVVIGEDDQTTGIRTMYSEPVVEGVYDLSGRRLSQPRKGINIINGKKILVK